MTQHPPFQFYPSMNPYLEPEPEPMRTLYPDLEQTYQLEARMNASLIDLEYQNPRFPRSKKRPGKCNTSIRTPNAMQ